MRLVFPVPVSGVSVEGEDALVVVAVVAACVGDVGEPGVAEGAGDQVAESGVGAGLVPGADLLGVFAEGDVPDIMLAVFDGPVPAGVCGQVAGSGQLRRQAGDAVGDLLVLPGAVRGAGVAADAHDLGGVRPGDAVSGGGTDAALLAAAVSFAFFSPGSAGEAAVRAGQGGGGGLQKGRLVALDDHQVVRFLVPGQVAGGFRLRMQGVQGDHLADEVQVRDDGGQLRDLVGLGVYLPLGAHHPGSHVEDRQQVHLAAITAD